MKLYYTINPSFMKASKEIISGLKTNDYVFLSCHVKEEENEDYIKNIEELSLLVNKKKGRIIADVSKRTLAMFKVKDFNSLVKLLNIYALRIDFGLTLKEIVTIAKKNRVVVNASTLKVEELIEIKKYAKELIAMHNYYPRKETGNSVDQFIDRTMMFKEYGVKVFAFIAGNKIRRGPMFEGLPTIESMRDYRPYVSYIELDKLNILDAIFVGDIDIDERDKDLINFYNKNKVIPLFTNLKDKNLLNKIFTNRIDSPRSLIRIKESREYATIGNKIAPHNCVKRDYGDITIDNARYKRYSGELMIMKDNFPKDIKVNVIGAIKKESLPLLEYINEDDKFIFIK